MRRLLMAALTAFLAIGAIGGIRLAQAVSRNQGRSSNEINAMNMKARVPGAEFAISAPQGGDYVETCREIRRNGSMLYAQCQKRDGGWRSTSLNTRNCRSQIVNDNGYLTCAQSGGGHYGRPGYGIPPGDYRRTCNDIRVNGERLEATCQKVDGGWRSTSLDNYQRCGNLISNVDGQLRCGR
jgi:hypothetical protein